ncbi:hypothetical protein [Aneurinibacillus aneurinilyticus]|uniref:YmcC n=1 Tax=Aneurinibacillus aneurinilyticus TaxID=1391 RepID=A0A848D0E5_ANEAE|nr:hypothetical protein [Aneurinibacillus aneurinilyticus]MED0705654.1 hypothetical protein [Aneurinibacillus aneurinilyticus]MED0724242.1 hypothetical protein [Aneurinibacillus aneurinilyticus]MED0734753.1 hypothetical protein [Aneurinibacillus aneurinilyticus]MED0743976.1 hypothetical protein [Aneurinibacillus aneurinilyticus]NMF01464.1 hypothetical protein [Aneurinibacillus aneurinilyticus]
MSFVAWMIVACEIAFWVVIVLGLVMRYVFKLNALGLFLLALTPVIDLVLLIITGIDLYRGATATQAHAIAAVYIGISIAFGKSMIRWADERFQYYVTRQGPKPPERFGMEYARHYLKGWVRHALAYLIGAGLLAGMIYLINDPSRTGALSGILRVWTVVLGVDFIIAISHFIWPKKAKARNSRSV